MKNRDAKTKQAFIEYLQQDTDERFWQAVSNFAHEHGLCKHYLLTTDHLPNDWDDLFYQESDEKYRTIQ